MAALRLNEDEPIKPGMDDTSSHSRKAAPINPPCFDIDRPSWAPQFLPDSTATATSQSQSSQIKALRSQMSSNGAATKRQNSQFFPISAFLACPDLSGRFPSKSKFLESKAPEKVPQPSESSVPPPTSSSHAQHAATKAAHRALTSRSLQTKPTTSTDESDIQQKGPPLLPTVANTPCTPCPLSLVNMSSNMIEPTFVSPSGASQPTEPETANGKTGTPSIAHGLGREPPFLDAEKMNVNPRFHGCWQRRSIPTPAKVRQSETLMSSGHARIRLSPQEVTVPAKPHARCYIPQQPGRKSKFFADGKLIARESTSTAQQPVLGTPSFGTSSSTSPAPESSSRPPFGDPFKTSEAEHPWNAYQWYTALSDKPAASSAFFSDIFTSPNTRNDEDSIPQRSPNLDICHVNSKPSTQDNHRATISKVLALLEAEHKESVSKSDTDDFDTVSLLSEYDIIDPVTTKSMADSWEEVPTPPETTVDVEPIDDSDCDDEDDEYYSESYFQSH